MPSRVPSKTEDSSFFTVLPENHVCSVMRMLFGKNKKQTCSKPGSVLTVIYLSGLPMRHRRGHLKPVYLALLRVGFTSH